MNPNTQHQARTAVAEAAASVLSAFRLLALHGASFTAYPGHEEASDSLGRALTEVNEAVRALADPPEYLDRMPELGRPVADPSRAAKGVTGRQP